GNRQPASANRNLAVAERPLLERRSGFVAILKIRGPWVLLKVGFRQRREKATVLREPAPRPTRDANVMAIGVQHPLEPLPPSKVFGQEIKVVLVVREKFLVHLEFAEHEVSVLGDQPG